LGDYDAHRGDAEESQRHQDRTQARLLAESALLILRDTLSAEKGMLDQGRQPLLAGEIKGQGSYTITQLAGRGAERRLLAVGAVAGRQGRFICEIETAIESTTQTTSIKAPAALRVTDIRHRVEPLKH